MSATGMKVTFATVAQAQSDVSTCISNINQRQSDLKSYLAPMIGAWEGGASTDYQTLQKRWDTSAEQLTTILGQVRSLLGMSHDAYTDVESRNAGTWG